MAVAEFCNCLAWQKGLDPVGCAPSLQRLLALEVAPPWPRNPLTSLPPALGSVLEQAKGLKADLVRTPTLSNILLVATDRTAPSCNHRRALVWDRSSPQAAHFTRREYLLPDEALADFGWAVSFRPEWLPQFEPYRVNQSHLLRDFLVCTHGTRDAACGKFGYRLYDQLKSLTAGDPHWRVWRASHLGGHVFAPTMLELPAGVFWGNLSDDTAEQVVRRRGDVSRLRLHYRGWSGAKPGFAQAAEREMLLRRGWSWLDLARVVEVTAQDQAQPPQWAQVRIAFAEADGSQSAYTAQVEVSHYLETIDSTGQTLARPYAQYAVRQLNREQLQLLEESTGVV